MKKRCIAILFIAFLMAYVTVFAEQQDHHDFFLSKLPDGGFRIIGDEDAVDRKARQTPRIRMNKARFRDKEGGAQFVDLPGGGFLAVWNDVTVLDDAAGGRISCKYGLAGSVPTHFLLEGGALRDKAACHGAGMRMLIVRRGGGMAVAGLYTGFATYDNATGMVSLTEEKTKTRSEDPDGRITEKDTTKVLNYLRGYCMGEDDWGPNWAMLFGDRFGDAVWDSNGSLEIPVVIPSPFNKWGFDIDGRIILRVDVTSADFDPFDFDVDMSWSVGLKCNKVGIDLENPSIGEAIPLIPFAKVEIIPGLVSFNFSPKLFASAGVVGKLLYKLDVGYGGRLIIDDDFDAYYLKQQWADAELISSEMAVQFYSGLQVGGSLGFLEGVIGVGLGYKDGYVLNIKEEKPIDPALERHICGIDCVQGNLFRRHGPVSLGLTLLEFFSYNLWTIKIPVDEAPLYNFYFSKAFGDSGKTKCPHYGYLLQVIVRDSETDELEPDVTVGWEDPQRTTEKPFEPYASATTDGGGKAELFVPRANPSALSNGSSEYTVTVRGGKDSEHTSRVSFVEKGYAPGESAHQVTLYLGDLFYTVRFYNHNNELLHEERRFVKEAGEIVSLTEDDETPTIDGNLYIMDQNAANVKSAEVKADDSTVLKAYYWDAARVSFRPGDGAQIRPMKDAVLIKGFQYETPPTPESGCYTAPKGKRFLGWQTAGETSRILEPGERIQVAEDMVLTAVWRSPWENLQAALDRAVDGEPEERYTNILDENNNMVAASRIRENEDPGHEGRWLFIQLQRDIKALPEDPVLVVPAGVNASVDFWGTTLNRGFARAREDGYVIRVEGNLELKMSPIDGAGTITGGCNTKNGGGVYVAAGGKLTMRRGMEIAGNSAKNGGGVCVEGTLVMEEGSAISGNTAESCGGVLVMEGGSFAMNGGIISGNEAGYGGGVGTAGSFAMTGRATITENTAAIGAGVFVREGNGFTMKVSRFAEVYENFDWNGKNSNVFLCENAVINADGKYSSPGIGVSVEVPPKGLEQVPVFKADMDSESAFYAFHNETKGKYILSRKGWSNGVLMTEEALTFPEKAEFFLPAGILYISAGAFAGISAKTVEIPQAPDGFRQTIGPDAFRDSGIQRIRIPSSVRAIDDTAFAGCEDAIIFGSGLSNRGLKYAREHGMIYVDE